jgi:hypothetical protein
VGNEADVAGNQVSRSLPLLNNIPGQGTPPHIVPFDPQNEGHADAQFLNSASYLKRSVNLGDMDGDLRDDFGLSSFSSTTFKWSLLIFMSSYSVVAPAFTIAAPVGDAGFVAKFVTGGDFDGDGKNDLAICSSELTTTTDPGGLGADAPGANGGGVYLYFGVAGTGLAHSDNVGDAELPSLVPDVALLGPAGSSLCAETIVLANVDGLAGDDLVFMTAELSNQPGVYGFSGGSRDRFGVVPVKVNARLSQTPDGSAAGIADFKLRGKNIGEKKFPTAMAVADVNGDGALDIAVSDYTTDHDSMGSCDGCGEIYVWKGGVGLSGALPAPDVGSAQLMHIVRYKAGGALGRLLFAVDSPNPGDPGDWILVMRGSNIFVLKGSQSAGGLTPVSYPVAGTGVILDSLDRQDWDGSEVTTFGWEMASLGELDGHGGGDIVIGPGYPSDSSDHYVFLYSYDDDVNSATYNQLVKRVVMRGPAGLGVGLSASGTFFGNSTGSSGFILATYVGGAGTVSYYH